MNSKRSYYFFLIVIVYVFSAFLISSYYQNEIDYYKNSYNQTTTSKHIEELEKYKQEIAQKEKDYNYALSAYTKVVRQAYTDNIAILQNLTAIEQVFEYKNLDSKPVWQMKRDIENRLRNYIDILEPLGYDANSAFIDE